MPSQFLVKKLASLDNLCEKKKRWTQHKEGDKTQTWYNLKWCVTVEGLKEKKQSFTKLVM